MLSILVRKEKISFVQWIVTGALNVLQIGPQPLRVGQDRIDSMRCCLLFLCVHFLLFCLGVVYPIEFIFDFQFDFCLSLSLYVFVFKRATEKIKLGE